MTTLRDKVAVITGSAYAVIRSSFVGNAHIGSPSLHRITKKNAPAAETGVHTEGACVPLIEPLDDSAID
jgi:hypothetical protein